MQVKPECDQLDIEFSAVSSITLYSVKVWVKSALELLLYSVQAVSDRMYRCWALSKITLPRMAHSTVYIQGQTLRRETYNLPTCAYFLFCQRPPPSRAETAPLNHSLALSLIATDTFSAHRIKNCRAATDLATFPSWLEGAKDRLGVRIVSFFNKKKYWR